MSRAPDASHPDALIGQTIAGQFEIVKQLGAGGMGAVYLAEQRDMGRQVVIKVMHPELTVGNPQAVERFKREARAVAALNHPHIVQVYVFGQADDGRMYLAMEYIEGRDLASEIARGALAQGRALKILDQVAAALVEAHSRGIVHRDLKPENVMLAERHGNPDWVKVLDFGIAKIHSAQGAGDGGMEAAALTQQGAIFGTPRYMAPEQITGQPIDARTDLYALGVIFYEMLTGEHPFRAHSALDYLVKHVQEQVVMPSVARPGLGVHPRVEQILVRLVAKEPAERFQSAAELQREVRVAMGVAGVALTHTLSVSADAIVQAVQESERAATVTAAQRAAMTAPRSKRGLLWGLLGVAAVGGGVAAFVLASAGRAPDPVLPLVAKGGAADAGATGGADVSVGAGVDPGKVDAAGDTAVVGALAAGKPLEGFPVPEGTTLVTSTPRELRLESSAGAKAILAYYADELAGRVKSVPNGFEFTDPTSPWMSLALWPEGDRVAILVGRRELAAGSDAGQAAGDASDASAGDQGAEGRDEEVAGGDAGPGDTSATTAQAKPTTKATTANKTSPGAPNPTTRSPPTPPGEAAKKTPGETTPTSPTTPGSTPGTAPAETNPTLATPGLITRPNRFRNPVQARPGVVTPPKQPQKPVRFRPRY